VTGDPGARGRGSGLRQRRARRGVSAYLADGEADDLESALEIVLARFAELRNLEWAFGHRAGEGESLITRHRVDGQRAFGTTSLMPPWTTITSAPATASSSRPRISSVRSPPTPWLRKVMPGLASAAQ
jgi:hypothetical protein